MTPFEGDNRSNLLVLHLGAGSVEETTELLTTLPDAEVTTPEGVSVGGADGVRFDLIPTTTQELTAGEYPMWELEVGRVYAFHIVDVGGTTITIVIESIEPVIDAFEPEAIKVINTITWAELTP